MPRLLSDSANKLNIEGVTGHRGRSVIAGRATAEAAACGVVHVRGSVRISHSQRLPLAVIIREEKRGRKNSAEASRARVGVPVLQSVRAYTLPLLPLSLQLLFLHPFSSAPSSSSSSLLLLHLRGPGYACSPLIYLNCRGTKWHVVPNDSSRYCRWALLVIYRREIPFQGFSSLPLKGWNPHQRACTLLPASML